MKAEIRIFHGLSVFFVVIAAVYGYVTHRSELGLDVVGFPALCLTAGVSLMIGVYLEFTARSIDKRPEDDLDGEIAELSGDQGFYSPYSWWPMPLALGAAVVFLGLAAGLFWAGIGLLISALALVGWVYEYYTGDHAH